MGIALPPHKAYPPLVVDAKAVLAGPITPEFFQAVSGHGCQVSQNRGGVYDGQFSQGRSLKAFKSADSLPVKKPFRVEIAERPDHPGSI